METRQEIGAGPGMAPGRASAATPAARPRVVVIGAGIGGLCAAVRLAHGGCAVTVIEARATPGGKMRTVPSVAGPVDAGPTVLTLPDVFHEVFACAGERLEDHLTLMPQPILARHWWADGSTLDLHADPAATAAAIVSFAGARAGAEFHRFHARTAAAFAAFEAPMMRAAHPRLGAIAAAALRSRRLWPWLLPGMTLARALAHEFHDPRLRQMFGRYATYVGGSPYLSPAVLGLVWQAEARGVWVVQGGMHQLALALESLARAGGAEFRYGTAVERITTQWGAVNAVVLTDGATLPADRVVFNGDPAALTAGLLGKPARLAVPRSATLPRSLSAHVWSFAATLQGPAEGIRHAVEIGPAIAQGPDDAKGSAVAQGPAVAQGSANGPAQSGGLPLIHHNVLFASDPMDEFGPIARGQMPTDPTLYICAQDRATAPANSIPAAPPTGPERFEIILNAPAGLPFSAGDATRCRDLTLSQLARFGLTFDPMPQASDPGALTSPAQFARMFPASQGAIYGRSPHGLMAAFQRPAARSGLKGLFLAGGGVHPGAGVPMAARSGLHAAGMILSDLALPSASMPTAMPGGMSMASVTVAPAPFRSSGS